tara:strand:+ start:641 stop:955 length:315 start_codon:yes stop_codon:yes gene_type:complete
MNSNFNTKDKIKDRQESVAAGFAMEFGNLGLERYVPEKGWGYNVITRTWDDYCKYEVCPFYDGEIPMDMDVVMCRDLFEVGRAIEHIMTGELARKWESTLANEE